MNFKPNELSVKEQNDVFFSIIIPMYNREKVISRTLDSCLCQSFKEYEIIVVDDASDDKSIEVVESYIKNDSRIRLVTLIKNSGVCAARAAGVDNAKGRWIMYIDSDDTFKLGAFQKIYDEVCRVPNEVSEVRFCYWSDAYKQVTPIPLMPEGVIDFPKYLRWLEEVKNSDVFYCDRREVYGQINWPRDRKYASYFFFQFASRFKIMMSKEVIGTMHDDADNRNTYIKRGKLPLTENWKKAAYDNAVCSEQILQDFGREMIQCCPKKYKIMKRTVGEYYLRAGFRLKGLAHMLRYLFSGQLKDFNGWGILFLGIIGPNMLHGGRWKYRTFLRKK